MSAVKLLTRSGHFENVESVPATAMKNAFADVLDKVAELGILAITRHDKARAVMLSLSEYEALLKRTEDPLERLSDYFESLVAKMQEPETRTALDELFGTSSAPNVAKSQSAARG